MTRYKPKSDDDDWYLDSGMPTILQVIEEEDGPQDTGLLDANGVRIYRIPDKKKFGFI